MKICYIIVPVYVIKLKDFEVARILKDVLEEKELIMRWGLGEHFCALGWYGENKAQSIKQKIYVKEIVIVISI